MTAKHTDDATIIAFMKMSLHPDGQGMNEIEQKQFLDTILSMLMKRKKDQFDSLIGRKSDATPPAAA